MIWTQTRTVGAADGRGAARITISDASFRGRTDPGGPMPEQPEISRVGQIDSLWRLDLKKDKATDAIASLLTTVEPEPVLPPRPVATGDSWGMPVPAGIAALFPRTAVAKLTLVGSGTWSGTSVRKLVYEFNRPFDVSPANLSGQPLPQGWWAHLTGSAHLSGEVLMRLKDGAMLRCSSHLDTTTHTDLRDENGGKVVNNVQKSDSTLTMELRT